MSNTDSTPRTCGVCGMSEFNKSGRCAPCGRAYSATYRLAHPEKAKAATDKWRESNSEKVKEYMRQWRETNSERVANYDAAYKKANHNKIRDRENSYRERNSEKVKHWAKQFRIRNKESIAAQDAEYYIANAEKIINKVLRWQEDNPEACRIKGQNRRAKKNSSGKLSKGLAEKLLILQKGKCPCCSRPLGDDYHLDHIVPLSRGGLNVDGNIQLLRRACNLQKNAKMPTEFMRSRGFLL